MRRDGGHHGNQIIGNDIRSGYKFYCKGNGIVIYHQKGKYQKAQTKLEWTQDQWKALNTKVYSLYGDISNLRFSTAYNLKKT